MRLLFAVYKDSVFLWTLVARDCLLLVSRTLFSSSVIDPVLHNIWLFLVNKPVSFYNLDCFMSQPQNHTSAKTLEYIYAKKITILIAIVIKIHRSMFVLIRNIDQLKYPLISPKTGCKTRKIRKFFFLSKIKHLISVK